MRDRETQLEVVKGTLQAIDTELDLDAFARRFKEPDPQGSFGHLPRFVPLTQSQSVVFDSNAAALGGIKDAKLRRDIVSAYGKTKSLIDVVNNYTERRAAWEAIRFSGQMPSQSLLLQQEIESWAENIRKSIPELTQDIEALRSAIKNYLASNEGGVND